VNVSAGAGEQNRRSNFAGAGAPACTAEANRSVVIAMRPHADEDFGQLDPNNTPVEIAAKSKDGRLGFDPGVAQASRRTARN
jgi:hypothetical protein